MNAKYNLDQDPKEGPVWFDRKERSFRDSGGTTLALESDQKEDNAVWRAVRDRVSFRLCGYLFAHPPAHILKAWRGDEFEGSTMFTNPTDAGERTVREESRRRDQLQNRPNTQHGVMSGDNAAKDTEELERQIVEDLGDQVDDAFPSNPPDAVNMQPPLEEPWYVTSPLGEVFGPFDDEQAARDHVNVLTANYEEPGLRDRTKYKVEMRPMIIPPPTPDHTGGNVKVQLLWAVCVPVDKGEWIPGSDLRIIGPFESQDVATDVSIDSGKHAFVRRIVQPSALDRMEFNAERPDYIASYGFHGIGSWVAWTWERTTSSQPTIDNVRVIIRGIYPSDEDAHYHLNNGLKIVHVERIEPPPVKLARPGAGEQGDAGPFDVEPRHPEPPPITTDLAESMLEALSQPQPPPRSVAEVETRAMREYAIANTAAPGPPVEAPLPTLPTTREEHLASGLNWLLSFTGQLTTEELAKAICKGKEDSKMYDPTVVQFHLNRCLKECWASLAGQPASAPRAFAEPPTIDPYRENLGHIEREILIPEIREIISEEIGKHVQNWHKEGGDLAIMEKDIAHLWAVQKEHIATTDNRIIAMGAGIANLQQSQAAVDQQIRQIEEGCGQLSASISGLNSQMGHLASIVARNETAAHDRIDNFIEDVNRKITAAKHEMCDIMDTADRESYQEDDSDISRFVDRKITEAVPQFAQGVNSYIDAALKRHVGEMRSIAHGVVDERLQAHRNIATSATTGGTMRY